MNLANKNIEELAKIPVRVKNEIIERMIQTGNFDKKSAEITFTFLENKLINTLIDLCKK